MAVAYSPEYKANEPQAENSNTSRQDGLELLAAGAVAVGAPIERVLSKRKGSKFVIRYAQPVLVCGKICYDISVTKKQKCLKN